MIWPINMPPQVHPRAILHGERHGANKWLPPGPSGSGSCFFGSSAAANLSSLTVYFDHKGSFIWLQEGLARQVIFDCVRTCARISHYEVSTCFVFGHFNERNEPRGCFCVLCSRDAHMRGKKGNKSLELHHTSAFFLAFGLLWSEHDYEERAVMTSRC